MPRTLVGGEVRKTALGEYDVLIRGQVVGHLTTDSRGWYHLNDTPKKLYPLQQAIDECRQTLPKPPTEFPVYCRGCNEFLHVRSGTICLKCEEIVHRTEAFRCSICKEFVLIDEQDLHYKESHDPVGFVDDLSLLDKTTTVESQSL